MNMMTPQHFNLLCLYCSVVHVERFPCKVIDFSSPYVPQDCKNPFQVIKFIPTEIPIARHLKVKQVFILETSFKHNTFGIAI